MGKRRSVYRGLVGKPEGRSRRKFEDNFKMDIKELECGVMDSNELAEDRNRWRAPVNAVMNLRVP